MPAGTPFAASGSIDGEPGDDFLRHALGKILAVAKLPELPLEHISQLGFLVNTELAIFVKADRTCAETFDDDLDLVLRPRVGARLGGRGKPASEIGGQRAGEFLDFFCIEDIHDYDARSHTRVRNWVFCNKLL